MTDGTLTRETRIRISDAQVSAALEGETVILSMRDGIYFGLDRVGSRIWALAQQPTTLGAIAQGIVAEFDVDEATAFGDLVRLAQELAAHGLVDLIPASREPLDG